MIIQVVDWSSIDKKAEINGTEDEQLNGLSDQSDVSSQFSRTFKKIF